jgi:hypothetical protein
MKWTVFDFEFTHLLPNLGQTWPESLHISCGSIISSGDLFPQVWVENDANYLSEHSLAAFVDLLLFKRISGFSIATWGGSSSDWRLLMRECPSRAPLIKLLALDSIDIPMCSCIEIGVMMGLNSACKGLGFSLKEEFSSASMPDLWNTNRDAVIQHVSNDSHATLIVLENACNTGQLPWITKRGELKSWTIHFQSVRVCLTKDLPVVPWTIAPEQNAKLLARWLLLN